MFAPVRWFSTKYEANQYVEDHDEIRSYAIDPSLPNGVFLWVMKNDYLKTKEEHEAKN